MLINYPKGLRLPLLSSYGLSQNSNLLRTQMASGSARVRQRFHSVPTVMAASWKLNKDQASILEGFVTHGLSNAVNWFVMPVLTPQGLIEHDARFIKNPLESCSFNGGFWTYNANIEIKKRQVISEEVLVKHMMSPYTPELFVQSVRISLNNYLEL